MSQAQLRLRVRHMFTVVAAVAALSAIPFTANATAAQQDNLSSPNMSRIGGGSGYSAVVRDDGTLWTVGNRTFHARGGYTSTELAVVPGLSGVKYISTSQGFGYALLENGQVMAWGVNNYQQLGDGTTSARARPVAIALSTNDKIVAVSAGYEFGMLLTESGNVLLSGRNNDNQLANVQSSWGQVQFPNNEKITYISAGNRHALAIDQQGRVWSWGSNQYGQLGRFSTSSSDFEAEPYLITALPSERKFVKVAAGRLHGYAVDDQGELWSWGYDNEALGRDAGTVERWTSEPAKVTDPNIQNVVGLTAASQDIYSAGELAVLTSDNQYWAIGANRHGQLATGTTQSTETFVQMRLDDLQGDDTQPLATNAVQFGYRSTLGLANDSLVYGWGENTNSYNNLAQNDRTNKTLPVSFIDIAEGGSPFTASALSAPQRPYYWFDAPGSEAWHYEKDGKLTTPALEEGQVARINLTGTFYPQSELVFTYNANTSEGELQLLGGGQLLWSSADSAAQTSNQVRVAIGEKDAYELSFGWIANSDQSAATAEITAVHLPAGELPVISLPQATEQYLDAVQVQASVQLVDGAADVWLETNQGVDNWQRVEGSDQYGRNMSHDYSYTLAGLSCDAAITVRVASQSSTANEPSYSAPAEINTLSCDTNWLSALNIGAGDIATTVSIERFFNGTPDFSATLTREGAETLSVSPEYDSRSQQLLISGLQCESIYQLSITAEYNGGSVTQGFDNLETADCVVGYDITGGTSFSASDDQCFIATAAFGSLLHPKVNVLRQFRDERLRGTVLGDAFIRTYYQHSPKIADKVRESGWLAGVVRALLWPVVGLAWLALHMPVLLALGALAIIALSVPAVRLKAQAMLTGLGRASKRLLAAAAALVVVSGCASGPSATHEAEQHMREQMRQMTNEPGWNIGHGVGMDEDEAVQNARNELAQQVLVNVRSESERLTRENGEELSESFTRSVFSWSNVQLENAAVDVVEKHGDGWYARLRMTDRDLRRSIERAHRNAPSLDKVLQLERVLAHEPARRLRRALEGLAIVQRDGVGNEAFTKSDGGSATFSNYFRAEAEHAVNAMRVLPILEKSSVLGRNQLRFALIDRETHRPQSGVVMLVDGREMVTDEVGLTDSIGTFRLSNSFDVHVLGYSRSGANGQWLHPELDVLHNALFVQDELTQAASTTVVIYKDPDNANIIVNGVSQEAPRELELRSDKTYVVRATTEAHRSQEVQLEIPQGAAYAFLDFRLQEREYGTLSLNTEGRANRFKVFRNGQLVLTSDSNSVEQEVEIGVYNIQVGRLERDESFDTDFQVIEHRFNLTRDDFASYNYTAPEYRDPYHHGWRFGFMFIRGGGALQDEFSLPWVGDREITVGELTQIERVTDVERLSGGGSLELQVQRYFNVLNLTAQFAAGTTDHQLTLNRDGSSSVDMELESWFASAGIGFWHSAFDDVLISSLTVNAGVDMSRWASESQARVQLEQGGGWQDLSTGRVTNTYTFAELNTHFGSDAGSGVSLGIQVPLDTFDPMVRLGVSLAVMDSGYRIPARASAQRGRHIR